MLCQNINKKIHQLEEALLHVHAASIWKENARKKLPYSWLTYFVLSVSWNQDTAAGWKAHLYFISSLMTLYIKSRIVGWNDTLHPCLFFSEDGTVTKICHNVACCLSSPFKFSSEINIKNPKIVVQLISPKISGGKKLGQISSLMWQSNLSNRRFIFVFRALKLCKHSLNTFLRGT